MPPTPPSVITVTPVVLALDDVVEDLAAVDEAAAASEQGDLSATGGKEAGLVEEEKEEAGLEEEQVRVDGQAGVMEKILGGGARRRQMWA